MQENMGKSRQRTLVWAGTKISRKSAEGKIFFLWYQQAQTDRALYSNGEHVYVKFSNFSLNVYKIPGHGQAWPKCVGVS